MLILLICVVVFFTVSDYLYTKNNFEHESSLLQIQTEQHIKEALRHSNTARNILEEGFNARMERGLVMVLAEYEQSGSTPSRMDLERVRERLDEGMDIYVIDASGVVVATTFTPALGEDFKTIPYFYEYLTKIRMSEGFFPDHIVNDITDGGTYRKFAYMPTADHRYILELGLGGASFTEIFTKLNDRKNIEQIVAVNPYVLNFRIFNSLGLETDTAALPDERVRGYVQEVLKTRNTLEVFDPDQDISTRYLMVDLRDEQYGSDLSRVVAITYNTGRINDALNRRLLFHVVAGVSAIGLGCFIAFVLSRRLSYQIQEIAEDADIIAHGDLEHRITSPGSSEFAVLEKSINTMVDSLKDAFQKAKDDKKFQQDIIAQVPVAVFMKGVQDGRYLFWNRASEMMFGRPASEVIGKTDRELFPEDVVAAIELEDQEALIDFREGKMKKISNKLIGKRIIHLIIIPITDSNAHPRYLLGIAEDLTGETFTVKKDLMFSITRRDILDQLSTIMKYLERAQLKRSHEAMQAFFDKTIGSVESIRDRIAFVRSLQDPLLSSSTWQSVKQSFDEAAALLPKTTVAIRVEVDGIEIYADPLLPRAFYNLLDNSLKHGGSQLTTIRLHAHTRGDTLILLYEDDGRGIPVEEKTKVCEFGYGTGKGLGLFLTCEILGFTGITMAENGEPGNGVRFEILVPRGRFRYAR